LKIGIACHPTYGGSGVVAAELGMALARRGHEVHFVSYQQPFRIDPMHPGVQFHRVEVSSYPLFRYPPYALALANGLLDLVRSHGVRLLHAHYAIPHSIGALLAREMCPDCRVRVITTLHGTDITLVGSEPSYGEITRWAINSSDQVTAVSDWLASASREGFRIDKHIEVIPNFIDVDRYRPELRNDRMRERFARPDEKLLVHVSNFRPVKRVSDVIKIFAGIAAAMPTKLVMVGEGPELAACRKLARDLSISDGIHWLGTVPEVAELLACSDLLLLPSEAESFGLVALEAMACAVPVLGTQSGGLPEVVENNESGLLLPVGDVEQMVRRAVDLLADEPRYRSFSSAARRRAEERFSLEKVVQLYESCYERELQT